MESPLRSCNQPERERETSSDKKFGTLTRAHKTKTSTRTQSVQRFIPLLVECFSTESIYEKWEEEKWGRSVYCLFYDSPSISIPEKVHRRNIPATSSLGPKCQGLSGPVWAEFGDETSGAKLPRIMEMDSSSSWLALWRNGVSRWILGCLHIWSIRHEVYMEILECNSSSPVLGIQSKSSFWRLTRGGFI